MEKQIIDIENEIELTLLKNELEKMEIGYTIIYGDSTAYPVSIGVKPYAIIVSDDKNESIILEIIENIRESYIAEGNDEISNNMQSSILIKILMIVGGFLILLFIISQQITLHNYKKALEITNESYVYKWSADMKVVKTFSKEKMILLQIGYDEDKNKIFEKIETFLPDGMVILAEDLNQNYFFEKQIGLREEKRLFESYSTDDNGIYDKTLYFKNSLLEKTVYYDHKINDIKVE